MKIKHVRFVDGHAMGSHNPFPEGKEANSIFQK